MRCWIVLTVWVTHCWLLADGAAFGQTPAGGQAVDFALYPTLVEAHDPSAIIEIAPGVYSTFASSNPDWADHLRQLVLDTNQASPEWRLAGHWPTGQAIPGFNAWSLPWWQEYGYDPQAQVAHLEVAAVAPTQVDANTVYFNMRNIPGAAFARENQIEPAMFMAIYRATATGDWPNQTWAMDPLPVYFSDGYTWELGGPRAVDAQVWDDHSGARYMTFGSWDPANQSVIAIAELDPQTGRVAGVPTDEPAYYAPHAAAFTTLATFGEAAQIYQRGLGDYYLFLNLESCCSGAQSTYQIVVGRADSPTGPFVDRDGRRFDAAYPETPENAGLPQTERFAGTLVLATEGAIIGPGHAGFFEQPDGSLTMSYHFYDGLAAGEPRLATREVVFDATGWPLAATGIAGDYNADGRVDGADLAAWQSQFGMVQAADASGRYSADGNGNGRVDGADYAAWRNAAATASAAPAGVPEPAATALAAALLALLGGSQRPAKPADSTGRGDEAKAAA